MSVNSISTSLTASQNSNDETSLNVADEDIEVPTFNEDLDDPLSIKQLSLNFDYLMYKINDKMKNLSEMVYESVVRKQELTNEVLADIDEKIRSLSEVWKECDQLENEFMKLEQLGMIVREFEERIGKLEKRYEAVSRV